MKGLVICLNEKRINKLKSSLLVAYVAYHNKIKKFMLRVVILVNFIFFVYSAYLNSMLFLVYVLNLYYCNRYYIKLYGKDKVSSSKRYKV